MKNCRICKKEKELNAIGICKECNKTSECFYPEDLLIMQRKSMQDYVGTLMETSFIIQDHLEMCQLSEDSKGVLSSVSRRLIQQSEDIKEIINPIVYTKREDEVVEDENI